MSSKGATEMGKRLQSGSYYDQFDIDGDGIVCDDEMSRAEQMMMIENEDKKQDAQRNMAWFALGGMLFYPFAVVLATWLGLEKAGEILGDMAATYFVSVAAIVAAFYGKEAFVAKTNPPVPRPSKSVSVAPTPAPKGPAPQPDEVI